MRSHYRSKTIFIPTRLFLKQWRRLGGTSDCLNELSAFINESGPENLKRISGMLRVVRAPLPGRGKRGGVRVVIFAELGTHVFYMTCYDRKKKSGLTQAEKETLDARCEEILDSFRT